MDLLKETEKLFIILLMINLNLIKMKTHKVVDLVENSFPVFVGTEAECNVWVSEQGYGYEVVPLTKEELEFENDNVTYSEE